MSSSFGDLFPGETPVINVGPGIQERIPTNNFQGKLSFVSWCFFNNIDSTENGGCICVSGSDSSKLGISFTLFSNCSSSISGGCVYLSQGEFSMKSTCASFCKCRSEGQFTSVSTTDNNNAKNNIVMSSMIFCGEQGKGYAGICALNGKQIIESMNSSLTRTIMESSKKISNSVESLLSFNSFINNTCTGDTCFWFLYGYHQMKQSNIIANSQPRPTHGIIFADAPLVLIECVLLENKEYYYFRGYSGTIIIQNCTCDKYGDPSFSVGSVQTTMTPKTPFNNILTFLIQGECYSKHTQQQTKKRPKCTGYHQLGNVVIYLQIPKRFLFLLFFQHNTSPSLI